MIPFPRNKRPIFGPCILHGHFLYQPHFGKMIGIVRDGRDVMVSAYFHFLFENERNPKHLMERTRKAVPFSDYSDVEKNLPAFITFMFEQYAHGRFHLSWSESVRSFYDNEKVKIVKYEKLLVAPTESLQEAIVFLEKTVPAQTRLKEIVDRFSFKALAQRQPGEENRASFLRKGIAGDWKNYFTEEASDVFNSYAGEELSLLGYEKRKLG